MCRSRLMNNKSNRLHERCLCIIYDDKTWPFVDLSAKDGSVTIHTQNLRVLATEMFKVHKNMSPELTHYNLRNPIIFIIINFVYHSSASISNLAAKIWILVADRLKELDSISSFRKEIER